MWWWPCAPDSEEHSFPRQLGPEFPSRRFQSTESPDSTHVSSILSLGGEWWLGQALAPFSPQANSTIGPWPYLSEAQVCSQLGRGAGYDGASEMASGFFRCLQSREGHQGQTVWEAYSEPGKVPPLMSHLWEYLSGTRE